MAVGRRTLLKGAAGILLESGRAFAEADPATQRALSGPVSVRDLGAKGDGVNNDRAAVVAALRVSRSIVFPSGDYFLGDLGGEILASAIVLRGNGFRIQSQGRVRLIVNTVSKAVTAVFQVSGVNDLIVGDFEIEDRGGDLKQKWKGAVGFLFSGTVGQSTKITLGRIRAKNLVCAVMVTGGTRNRVSDITIKELICEHCYYGLNCQENGDHLVADSIDVLRCNRAYFVYGVTGHRVRVYSRDGAPASADCLIKRYQYDTSDIGVRYTARNSNIRLPNGLVVFEHQPNAGTGPGLIRDVTVELDVDSASGGAYPVLFRSYTPEGQEETGHTDNAWNRVTLAGSAGTAGTPAIHANVRPHTRGRLTVVGSALRWDNSVDNAFNVDFAEIFPNP